MLVKQSRPFIEIEKLKRKVFVNLPTIEDEAYFEEQIPGDSWERALQEGNFDVVFKVFWRLMDDESKRCVRDANIVRWDGLEEIKVEFYEPEKKLAALISGHEVVKVVESIIQARVLSLPVVVDNQKKSPKVEGR